MTLLVVSALVICACVLCIVPLKVLNWTLAS